jgi:hypothetical protein
VEFRYYRTNSDGEKVGAPVHITSLPLFSTGIFGHATVVPLSDKSFIAPEIGVYYVEVVVDP